MRFSAGKANVPSPLPARYSTTSADQTLRMELLYFKPASPGQVLILNSVNHGRVHRISSDPSRLGKTRFLDYRIQLVVGEYAAFSRENKHVYRKHRPEGRVRPGIVRGELSDDQTATCFGGTVDSIEQYFGTRASFRMQDVT